MMLKIAFALLALWALAASAQECPVTLCPASTKCVEYPHECTTYPCAQVKCVPIGTEDPCAASACTQDQVCLPEPKWCIRAPCPQYRCVSYEEFTCATALCPYNTKCTYSPKQCFTTPCPQYDCEPQDAVDETCATAVCPQNSVCVSEPKQCFTTPCPQFACLPKTECPEFCTEEYSPVCGSDKRTYSNLCELRRAMCVTKVSLYVSSSGPCDVDLGDCPAFCPANYEPVCGSDSNTYSNLCTLQRSACQTKASISVAHQGACEDCNFACTLEYAPVCGSDGNTYANLCSLKGAACRAKSSITAQYSGECKTAETTCPEFCPMNYSPVCGTDAHTYSNLCLLSVKACKEKSSLKVAHEGACSAQVNVGAKTQEPNTAGVVVGIIIAFVVGVALIVAGYMYIKKRNAPKAPQFSQFVNESL